MRLTIRALCLLQAMFALVALTAFVVLVNHAFARDWTPAWYAGVALGGALVAFVALDDAVARRHLERRISLDDLMRRRAQR